jgi:hypothetical protein
MGASREDGDRGGDGRKADRFASAFSWAIGIEMRWVMINLVYSRLGFKPMTRDYSTLKSYLLWMFHILFMYRSCCAAGELALD